MEHATNALVATASKGGLADIFTIAAIAGAPGPPNRHVRRDDPRRAGRRADAQTHHPGAANQQLVRYDIEQRVGGNPSQNTGVDYSARIGAQNIALIGDEWPSNTAQAGGGRPRERRHGARRKANRTATRPARSATDDHDAHRDDPSSPVQNETLFGDRVADEPRGA